MRMRLLHGLAHGGPHAAAPWQRRLQHWAAARVFIPVRHGLAACRREQAEGGADEEDTFYNRQEGLEGKLAKHANVLKQKVRLQPAVQAWPLGSCGHGIYDIYVASRLCVSAWRQRPAASAAIQTRPVYIDTLAAAARGTRWWAVGAGCIHRQLRPH